MMKHIADFERRHGRVPTIRELAQELRVSTSGLRVAIGKNLGQDKVDGTSAFHTSLQEMLLGNRNYKSPLDMDWGLAKYREILVRNLDGTELGLMQTKFALQMAKERGLVLYPLDPCADPPVAMFVDCNSQQQDMFQKLVQRREASKKVKELKLQISANDFQTKLITAKKVLEKGDELRLAISLKKNELDKADIAVALLNQFATDLGEIAVWTEEPKLEGKIVAMNLFSAL